VELLLLAILVALAYLLGSIPTGLLVARARGVDLLAEGSGKTGATNTMNAVGKGAAALVLAVDLVKGALAVLLAFRFPWEQNAVLGHNYSVWVRLASGRWGGGRGIVTAMGAMLMLHPLVVLAAILVGLAAIALTRLMVVGTIAGTIGAVGVAVILVATGSLWSWFLPAVIVWAVLVIAGFYDNLQRLARGAEPKLGRPG
jgi:glycerol-3-phosphate acyltransferase PlsY